MVKPYLPKQVRSSYRIDLTEEDDSQCWLPYSERYSSILAIPSEQKNTGNFFFSFILKEDVLRETTMLDNLKAIQESNILVKTIKENGDFFAEVICKHFIQKL